MGYGPNPKARVCFVLSPAALLFPNLCERKIEPGFTWEIRDNIGNFLRRLALPKSINDWSLRTMREKLVKIGAKVVSHARYVTFQMAEVVVSRSLFYEILERIKRLKLVPTG
jgi:hypothetical protein